MSKFIVIGNSHIPVNTPAERAPAGKAVAKQANDTNVESVTVYEGAPGFADDTGMVLDEDGRLQPRRRHFRSEFE